MGRGEDDGRWQLPLHLRGCVNRPFLGGELWFVCGCSQPSPPFSLMSFFFFLLFKFLHKFSISSLWKTEQTKHAENTCTHLSAEPKKKRKEKEKTLVHSLGNVDPKISESPPAVFSLAPRLCCWFRGYVIYVYADMCISQHSRQLSWAEFSCLGPRHCLLARWAVKSRTRCHRGPAAVWKRVRL